MRIPKQIKELEWPEEFHGGNESYAVMVRQPTVNHERLLVLDFTGNRNRRYQIDFRIVCSKKQKDFAVLSQDGSQKRMSIWESTKGHVIARSMYPYISAKDETVLARWLGNKRTANHQIDNLDSWINETIAEHEKNARMQREAKKKARGELVDDDVNLCPEELPEGLEEWIRTEVLANDATLLYKKGNVRGTCFLCGEKVKARKQRFRQGETSVCPNCGETVLCVLENGTTYKSDYVRNIIAMQKGTDGQTVFFRQWHVRRDPSAKYEKIEEWLEEFGRYAAKGYSAVRWLHEYKENHFMFAYRYRLKEWERFSGTEVYDGPYQFYIGSVASAVAGTRLQYADIQGYCSEEDEDRKRCRGWKNVVRYAMDWTRYPVMEFLWKAGYRQLVFERVAGMSKEDRNAILWSRRELKECFRFPLRLLRIKQPEEWCMRDIRKMTTLWQYKEQDRITEGEIATVMKMDVNLSMLEESMRYARLLKILKYLRKQHTTALHGNIEQTYRDYIRECQQLELDLTRREILFPRDLQRAHDRTMTQITFEKNKVDQETFQKQVRKLEKLSWENGGLLIRPARRQEELAEEGAALNHCVAGYIGNMASGKTGIFFIRRASHPEKPFYTLEFRDGKVIQCRTKHNASYDSDPEVKIFVDAWMANIVRKAKKLAA